MDFLNLTLAQWLNVGLAVGVLLATAIFGRWIIKFFFGRVLRRFTSFTKNTLDDAILESMPFNFPTIF